MRVNINFSFFWLLFVQFVLPAAKNPVEIIHENLTSRWCDGHPFVVQYAWGKYFNCIKKSNRYSSESLAQINLKGITLRVGVLESSDINNDREMENGRMNWMDEVAYNNYILRLLQDVLHFKITYVQPPNHSNDSNSKVLDVLDLMLNNEIDMSIGQWTVSHFIAEMADYLTPTLKTKEALVFVPGNLPLTEDVFLGTFSYELWIFFFLTIVLLVLCFKFSTYMHSTVRPDHEPWTWDEVILWAVATVSQQSYSRHPRGSSCRTMFFMGYAISYLLFTGFAAGITSLLALNGHRTWLTFSDISSMELTHLFLRDEYYYKYYFKIPGRNATSFFENNVMDGRFEDLPGIFTQIAIKKSVGYGTIASFANYLKKLEPNNRAMYRVLPFTFFQRQKSFLVRKSFPYKELFNFWLLKFSEIGLLHLAENQCLTIKEESLKQSNPWLSADLKNVFSAFIFVSVGWILATIVLFIEMIYWKRSQTLRRALQNDSNIIKPLFN